MKTTYDKEADAKYVSIHKRKIVATQEVYPWLLFDLDIKERVVGVEILNASAHPVRVSIDSEGKVYVSDISLYPTSIKKYQNDTFEVTAK